MSTVLFQLFAVLLPVLVAAAVVGIGLLWLALAVSTVGAMPRLRWRLTPQPRIRKERVFSVPRCGPAHTGLAYRRGPQARRHRTQRRPHRTINW
jgi:hypothetical protein